MRQVPELQGRQATLSEALEAAAIQFGERDAYVEGARRVSFAQWLKAADSLAAAYLEYGVRRGDVVAIALDSSIDYAVAFAAAIRMGAVATGLNTRLAVREMAGILQRCTPRLLIHEEGVSLPAVALNSSLMGRTELRKLSDQSRQLTPPTLSADDAAVIVWTSGTTGVPKGAWFDHRRLYAAVGMAGPLAEQGDRRLVPTPFAHSGYMTKLWEQLAYGMALVISPVPWRADEMLKLIAQEKVTVAGAVPTQWTKLIELPQLAHTDISSLRLCVSATAPASPELLELAMQRLACPFIVRYAMTESPSITGTRPSDSAALMFSTVGKPQVGVEVQIVDGAGRLVSDGEIGRVRVRSAAVMGGYWRDEAATAQALDQDGWLASEDLGQMDAQGYLTLVGRSSDMYIRGGYNIHPLEVERVLLEHPAVGQVSVVGIGAPVIGEMGIACVVPSDPSRPPTLQELQQWCDGHIADYKRPDRVLILRELPLTSMLKVDKVALRRMAGNTDGLRAAVGPTASQ